MTEIHENFIDKKYIRINYFYLPCKKFIQSFCTIRHFFKYLIHTASVFQRQSALYIQRKDTEHDVALKTGLQFQNVVLLSMTIIYYCN